MNGRIRPAAFVLLAALSAGGIGLWIGRGVAAPTGLDDAVSELKEQATRSHATLQSAQSGLGGRVDTLGRDFQALERSLSSLRRALAEAGRRDAGRIDDISGAIDSMRTEMRGLEQRIWVLETRYDDHLRRYHGN